jgi:hypothetical protein
MTIKAKYDGKVFIPAAPLDLPKDQEVLIEVQTVLSVAEKNGTGAELARSPIVGMWAIARRCAIVSPGVNEQRRRMERREI